MYSGNASSRVRYQEDRIDRRRVTGAIPPPRRVTSSTAAAVVALATRGADAAVGVTDDDVEEAKPEEDRSRSRSRSPPLVRKRLKSVL